MAIAIKLGECRINMEGRVGRALRSSPPRAERGLRRVGSKRATGKEFTLTQDAERTRVISNWRAQICHLMLQSSPTRTMRGKSAPMSTRPAPPRPIARWPFVAGDVILLALAVTALLAGGVPPDLGNIVAAIICAAFGAGLLLAPFLLEYEARLRVAEASARDAASGHFRRLSQTSEQLANVVSRSQATEEQAGQVLGSLEDLSERLATQSEELSQMLARIADGQNTVSKKDAERLAGETGARIDALAAAVAKLQKLFEGVVSKTVNDLAAIDRNIRAMEDLSVVGSDHDAVPDVADFEPEAAAKAVGFDTPHAPAKSPPKKRGSHASAAARKRAETGGALELALEEPPREHVTSTAKEAGVSEASLVATAYIGIGNKLYLRGEGPGLSWERGVPMEFLAIGKWGWKASEGTDSVTCRIYRNDDTPMLDADLVIAAGEKKEVTPRF